TQSKLYIDGQLRTLTQLVGTPATRSVTSQVRIGGWVTDSINYKFNGRMDEVAFYNRALSDAEVLAQYNARSSGNYSATIKSAGTVANLVGYYRMDETSGTTVLDSSGLAPPNHGSFTNAATTNLPTWVTSGALLFSAAPPSVTITVTNTADSGPGSLRQAI